MGLAGYFVAQSASDLSMLLTGNRTGVLRVQKHVVKATIYTTRPTLMPLVSNSHGEFPLLVKLIVL